MRKNARTTDSLVAAKSAELVIRWAPRPAACALLFVILAACAAGQTFEQRGFFESSNTFFPQAALNDSGHAVGELLLRWEASWQPWPWLKISGSLDARTDSHQQVERDWRLDVDDRSLQQPDFSLRRMSLMLHRGRWTAEMGRQFIRWGKTDILTPTDRFAPKDYLNVVSGDFLGVTAARLTYEAGNDTLDLVWQPWFTPSRIPLIDQRWAVLPEEARNVPIHDLGTRFPGGSQYGIRWSHIGRGYEYSLSYFDGYNNLPLFDPKVKLVPLSVDVTRFYPKLRLWGGAVAAPLAWFTVKAEGAYFTSSTQQAEEYVLYVIQLERTAGEWVFVGGYAGEAVTRTTNDPFLFAPDRGFARSFLGRASYTIGPTRSVAISTATRQNGKGTWLAIEYSETFGQHWRATTGFTWIRGDETDFLGQYHRNSFASLALRYSF